MGRDGLIPIIVVMTLVLVIYIIAIFSYITVYRAKKRAHQTIVRLQKEMHKKEILNTQLEIQQQTMGHIGREIHDNLGQKLTLASLNLQSLMLKTTDEDKQALQNINQTINGSLNLLRGLSKSLTDNRIVELNFYELIAEEIEKINQIKPFEINFVHSHLINFEYHQKVVLFRITQEFLQNSIKHANCKTVNLSLTQDQNSIYYKLSDDGLGFDFEKSSEKGIGLINMKKRIEHLEGTIEINSKINNGTTVKIYIPITHEENDSHS